MINSWKEKHFQRKIKSVTGKRDTASLLRFTGTPWESTSSTIQFHCHRSSLKASWHKLGAGVPSRGSCSCTQVAESRRGGIKPHLSVFKWTCPATQHSTFMTLSYKHPHRRTERKRSKSAFPEAYFTILDSWTQNQCFIMRDITCGLPLLHKLNDCSLLWLLGARGTCHAVGIQYLRNANSRHLSTSLSDSWHQRRTFLLFLWLS